MLKRILTLVIVVAAVGGGVWLFVHQGGSAQPSGQASTDVSALSPQRPVYDKRRTPPPGQREHYNMQYRFSLLYPDTLQALQYDETKGVSTITFQSDDKKTGFQIFITPYDKPQLDTERFALDEPSGVHDEPATTTVDGVQAVTFLGHNDVMGDTSEVWVIHGGFLYEITTYRDLGDWLTQILATWRFL